MIQLSNVSKSFADQLLFDNVTFQLGPRERIGLVGANGSGKSTLFRLILGEMPVDAGDVAIPRGYRIATLEQHIKFTQETMLEECCQVLEGDQQYDHFLAEKMAFGLGFSEEDLQKSPGAFSGGYQIRINLIKALLKNPNLLLLDEPTNYLDIVSLRWLKQFLRTFAGEVIIITHDREFMDGVCTHVMGLSRKKLKKIEGNTEKYYEQLVQEEEMYEKTRANLEKKRQHLQAFVDRFKAKASKAKQAQSKAKAIERMGNMDELENEETLSFRFHYTECPGKVVMNVNDVAFSFSGKKEEELFAGLNFPIERHDRIGIIGKNGKGKSTLLNVLGGVLTPTTGGVTHHPALQLGHFGQTNVQRLHGEHSIIQEIGSANPALALTAVRNICGTMMFEGDLAEKKIKVLSGGEKSRVLLGKILARPTNLLLLDEPTNHLDMESVEALNDEIKRYPGAVVIVTHSEYLLRNLVDKLVIFHQGRAEYFRGNYEDFLNKIGWESEEGKKISKKSGGRKDFKQKRAQLIQERAKVCGPLKIIVEDLEKKIIKAEEEMAAKTLLMEKGENLAQLSQDLGKLNIHIQLLFEDLEQKSLELESKTQNFERLLQELEE